MTALCLGGWLLGSSSVRADDRDAPDPDPFAKSYVSFEIARNYPTSF